VISDGRPRARAPPPGRAGSRLPPVRRDGQRPQRAGVVPHLLGQLHVEREVLPVRRVHSPTVCPPSSVDSESPERAQRHAEVVAASRSSRTASVGSTS
jgi:hypothetical protein